MKILKEASVRVNWTRMGMGAVDKPQPPALDNPNFEQEYGILKCFRTVPIGHTQLSIMTS